MQLVISEKPSVAQAIAKVIGAYKREEGYLAGSGYIVSWCVGHLVELAQPHMYDEHLKKWRIEDLPIVPDHWKYQISEGTKKQFFILKKLMERTDVTEIICATDAGREGELIFRLVYQQAGCKKPFKRLWISSMEDSAIRDGFANLRDGHDYDSLYAAAQARSWADWLVGMNGTRLFTKLYDRKLTVGCVQTPTLAMLVKRQEQIDGFQKQKYWNVHLNLDGVDLVKERIFEEEEARKILEECQNQEVKITLCESKEKSLAPPHLYDLTTLQREANRYFGYTAQETLNFTQSLYEDKLVTYPRTDSQYLSDDMEETAGEMVGLVAKNLELNRSIPNLSGNDELNRNSSGNHEGDSGTFNVTGSLETRQNVTYERKNRAECDSSSRSVKGILNSNKVTDHHAIIPTAEIANLDRSRLSKGERDILLLISMRLLAATAPKQRLLETEIRAECAGYEFTAKTKTVVDPGWKFYEDALKARINLERGTAGQAKNSDQGSESKASNDSRNVTENYIDNIRRFSKGETFPNPQPSLSEHFTSPPKAYSEDTLLSAMETAGNDSFDEDTEKKGLGTPATRADMIEKLVRNDFVRRKGKQLIPTEDGMALVQILPEEVKSPKMTADWENALKQIEKGEISAEEFMDGITKMVRDLVSKYGSGKPVDKNPFSASASGKPQCEELGKCPRCGSPVFEGNKNFYCSNRTCSFCLWKESKWLAGMKKKLNKKMVIALLKDGRVHVTGLYSQKQGRNFDADLVMEDTGTYVNYSLDFGNVRRKKKAAK